MKADNPAGIRRPRTWLREADCNIEAFARQRSRTTEAAEYPLADAIAGNVPVMTAMQSGRLPPIPRPGRSCSPSGATR
ncbi:hypothetical protein [Lichenicoccus sp.]|uniref:hypothetical protein n=1 Tax=Lichenicoccus sp. TaxID=2781899 RepID=UPI003D0ECC67